VGFHRLKDLHAEIVCLQEVAEGEDCVVPSRIRTLIRSMPAKRRMVGTSIRAFSIAGSLSEYHCCIRWTRKHRGQRIGRLTALGARPGVAELNQIDQRLPRHNRLHLRQKSLASGALPGRGLLVNPELQLLAAHEPRDLRSKIYFRADGLGFLESP
jgi:hypothetical protein